MNDTKAMDRRTFLKLGSVSAASAVGAAAAVAGARLAKAEDEAATTELQRGPVYRTLGRTGLEVSVVGVGAMRTTESAVLRAAFERGVNYVDTARCYAGGQNERIVAQAFEGRRDKVYVATKAHMVTPKEAIIQSVEESLKALQTDYVDIVQLHKPNPGEVLHPDAKEALTQLKKDGKVRFTGVSTHSNQVEVIDKMVADEDKFYDMVLVAYNFTSGQDLKDAVARAAKAGLGVVAMKTQGGGYKIDELADISPHQAALKWVLEDPSVHTAVPAMVDLKQVMEDTEVMGMPMSRTEKQVLLRYKEAIKPFYCHMCGACDGTCPLGVDICTVNRCLMYAEGYGDIELAKTTYGELPDGKSAAACGDCATCVAQCANGLDLAAKMRKAQALFA